MRDTVRVGQLIGQSSSVVDDRRMFGDLVGARVPDGEDDVAPYRVLNRADHLPEPAARRPSPLDRPLRLDIGLLPVHHKEGDHMNPRLTELPQLGLLSSRLLEQRGSLRVVNAKVRHERSGDRHDRAFR